MNIKHRVNIFDQFIFEAQILGIVQTSQTSAMEEISDDKATRNGDTEEDHNTYDIQWIMGNCVARIPKFHYKTKNI